MTLVFLLLEFVLVTAMALGAYRVRSRFGLGPVIAVAAGQQFLQAVVSSSLYWDVGGVLLSPGSCILFTGNLALLLYAYARDGILVARAILYGILVGNLIALALSAMIALHMTVVPPSANMLGLPVALFARAPSMALLGVALLYLDEVLAILLFAWLRDKLEGLPPAIPLTAALIVVLCFDTVCFVLPAFWGSEHMNELLYSGLISKSLGGLLYGLTWGAIAYRRGKRHDVSLGQLMGTLLFREDLNALREAAVTDSVTGLYNRRSYNVVLEHLSEQSSEFALLLCDADRFKSVNDVLGHATGDAVLIDIAETLRDTTREDDFSFRLGGDEFAVILPRCALEQAVEVAERLAAWQFDDPALERNVTMTIGVAIFPGDGRTPEALFAVADRRLYLGKEDGRNRVISEG